MARSDRSVETLLPYSSTNAGDVAAETASTTTAPSTEGSAGKLGHVIESALERIFESENHSLTLINNTTAKIIAACENTLNDPESTPEDRSHAWQMMNRAADQELKNAESVRQSKEHIACLIVGAAFVVVMRIVSEDHKASRSSMAA